MRSIAPLITSFIVVLMIGGCQFDTPDAAESSNSSSKNNETAVDKNNDVDGLDKKAMLTKAADLLKQAADSGVDGADTAQQWITDKIGDASESGSVIAGDAATWASDTFESLKDQGLTSADDARQWLTDDIRNMNALKYKIVRISLDDLESAEDELNKLGNLRWECFHAVQEGDETILFFKKARRSILKNIPVRDLMKLVPLMNGQDE